MTDSTPLLALLAKRYAALREAVSSVSKQIGPQGLVGETGAVGERGPQGEIGRTGERGLQGEIGLTGERGPRGERGADGATGERGFRGEMGKTGPQGGAGPAGPQGETGPAPDHQWTGTKLRFQKPDGKWGKYTDLKGDKGDGGGTVIIRGGASSGVGLESLLPGAVGVEPVGVAVAQGGKWVQLPWAAFISVISGAVDMGAKLSKRNDFVGDTIMYKGEAQPGSAESAAVWCISRIEFMPDGDVIEKFANGSAAYENVWDDRATLGYS